MNFQYKLGVIGAGNMAKAIVDGIVKQKLVAPCDIIVSDPYTNIGIDGIVMTQNNSEVFGSAEYVILAIKPQIFKEMATNWNYAVRSKHIMSIMAGIDTKLLSQVFNCNVTRVMPNTPCKLGLGMTAIANNNAPDSEKKFVASIFNSIGEVICLDEEFFHTVTSISGSGPAYVYMFIQGMIRSGIAQGLDYTKSKQMVLQTFRGAVAMVETSVESIDTLIEAVCSKGGTTIEAVQSYKSDDLYGVIDRGMIKCRNRSEELGK